jgi:hypothetical protein
MDRPTKISFGDMRAQGVRGLLIYCADGAVARSRSAVTTGLMMPGCPTLSRDSSVAPAAIVAPMRGSRSG